MPKRYQPIDPAELARREAQEEVFEGSPTLDQVATVLLSGVDSEEQTDWIVRRYLLTEEQRQLLYTTEASGGVGATVSDVLNGRLIGTKGDAVYEQLFTDWNRRLGRYCFGMDGRNRGQPFVEP